MQTDNKITLYLPQILGIAVITDIILFDQLSKWAITELVLRPELGGESIGLLTWLTTIPERVGFVSVPVMPSFNLTMVWNEGISFGLFQNAGIWPLTIVSGIICVIFAKWLKQTQSKFEAISLAAIIGGAIGNVIDRLRFGGVADFFDVYIGSYHWPSFNIADCAITIGVAMLLIHGLFLSREDNKT